MKINPSMMRNGSKSRVTKCQVHQTHLKYGNTKTESTKADKSNEKFPVIVRQFDYQKESNLDLLYNSLP